MKNDGTDILLEVQDLSISFHSRRGIVRAVNGISYTVKKGEVMGLVGESGGGKSVGAHAITGLLEPSATQIAGRVIFEGTDMLGMTRKELASFRGREISMIFQDPVSHLDPVFTIGRQMLETIRSHDKAISKAAATALSVDMLRKVGLHNPENAMRQYPFELSGGMGQRVMIALALLCKPKLLIADEPTTALDVTTQAQIIRLLKRLQRESGMAMLYITHNFGIVAELCDRVSVICGGFIMEQGTTDDIFYRTAHPYTKALLKLLPRMDSARDEELSPIEGSPIDPLAIPNGCVFHPRCPHCMDICRQSVPPETVLGPEHSAYCWLLDNERPERTKDEQDG